MNISLTPELEKWVQEKVKSGLYTSSSEVIREALRLLHEYETIRDTHLVDLQQKIAKGIECLNTGKMRELTESLVEEIKVKGRQRVGN